MKNGIVEKELQTAVLDEFCELAVISGVSGNEKAVADRIKQKTAELPFRLYEDEAGQRTGGNQGNLIFVPENFDPEKKSVAILAHMDTARDTGQTVVRITEDRVTSDGSSQLGADNRWGLTLLLNMMRSGQPASFGINIIYICTVSEENGMKGAKCLDLSPWNVVGGFVLDSSLRPGSYILECSGMTLFEAVFEGRAGHSAVQPRTGISAISMAAEALVAISAGNGKDGLVSNVGRIEGGSAVNVVPEKCTVWGEVRGADLPNINRELETYHAHCRDIAVKAGGSVAFNTEVDFEPYAFSPDNPLITLLEKAIRESGLNPEGVSYSGGSDANALHAKGIPAVNLGIGAQKPHSNEEFILLDDINMCIILTQNLKSILIDIRGQEL